MSAPFATGSVSLRMYPHDELPAAEIVGEMRGQAMLAADAGFDGVMTSEHHGGFAGYVPNPLQAAGWLLEAMSAGWAAPCPLLLPLRPPALVIEETAWLAARFPGRVGLGVAAGSLVDDFRIMGLAKDETTARFADDLRTVVAALSGRDAGPLANDPAVAACRESPVPVVSAAMSATAVRRAAELGVGILFDSMTEVSRCCDLTSLYRSAGGKGPVVLIRRAWVGDAPVEQQRRQLKRYRDYAAEAAQQHWQSDQLATGSVADVAEGLATARTLVGADVLNLRVHAPGVSVSEVRGQIEALGDVRQLLAGSR
jgi:alkanesulfonate monooxygenase SsuD/methylene tetrahydromethanopterin reductase-like flavin-dependent oxidoreductase (luciferase family)